MAQGTSLDAFTRQRRNLLLASSFLAFLAASRIRLEGFTFWSGALAAHNGWILYLGCWLLLAYCAYGFVVSFLALRLPLFRNSLAEVMRDSVNAYLHRLMEQDGGSAERTEVLEDIFLWPRRPDIEIVKYHPPFEDSQAPGGRWTKASVEQSVVRINRWLWCSLVLRGLLVRLFFGMDFFKYVLPVLWLAIAATIALSSSWAGSPGAIRQAWRHHERDNLQAEGVATLQQTLCDWRFAPRQR